MISLMDFPAPSGRFVASEFQQTGLSSNSLDCCDSLELVSWWRSDLSNKSHVAVQANTDAYQRNH